MNNPLATYLADHLAGSMYAIELLKSITEKYSGEQLGQFAAGMLVEVEADRKLLLELAERVGDGSSGLKELTAWLSEKASRLKLRYGSSSDLSTFEALEFLELGIHGKWALWRALATIAPANTLLQGTDYESLAARAEAQRAKVDKHRLEIARIALRPTTN